MRNRQRLGRHLVAQVCRERPREVEVALFAAGDACGDDRRPARRVGLGVDHVDLQHAE